MDNFTDGDGYGQLMEDQSKDPKKEIENFFKTKKKVIKKKNTNRIKKNYTTLIKDLRIMYEDFPQKETYDCIITLESIAKEIEKII